MFLAYLIYLARLNGRALIIEVVELDLDDLDLGIFRQDPVEDRSLVVE